MTIAYDIDLRPFTTFRTHEAFARQFYVLTREEDAIEFAMTYASRLSDILILGGGSNMLITRPVEAVVQVQINHRSIVDETSSHVVIRLGAGEMWHDCVAWAVSQGWAGIEAMALIPGTVGAAPIQNIGAYGQQFSDTCQWIEAVHLPSGRKMTFRAEECRFGYRDSRFKSEWKGSFIITAVGLKLEKRPTTTVHYQELRQALGERPEVTIQEVFECVINLRRSKLPPPTLGNAGSFFKNPIVPGEVALALAARYPSMPMHAYNGSVKLSAGWLIEQCGYKGIRRGDAGVYDRHALVLVNYGNARGKDILSLAREIKHAVQAQFGVELEEEVIIV